MKVLKFGGTSVGTPQRMKEVSKLITSDGQPKMVVLSAMSGTTNTLVEISDYLYKKNPEGANEIINKLESKRTSQDEIEERIMTKDLLDQIKEEMERLTEQQRIIYELNRDEDMTYKQIAEKLGISPKTVQYHISNVLAKLKKLL